MSTAVRVCFSCRFDRICRLFFKPPSPRIITLIARSQGYARLREGLPIVFWLDAAVKVALVGLLLFAYRDTLGDLAGGLTGSTLAALLTVAVAWRLQKEPGTNRFRPR
jgi:hypothetical protein